MTVQAKFWVDAITHQSPKNAPSDQVAMITMRPVYGDDNGDWSKYTPSGKIEMCITNPAAIEKFELGGTYLLTFEQV